MKISNLQNLPPDLQDCLVDAKEGVVDALLNLTWQRCSGAGPEGEVIYGTKASLQFVSGFLLPRYEETGQVDETSDIRLSTHGIDCQIAAGIQGALGVSVAFSIYVRALPSWEELVDQRFNLFPHPPLRKDLEESIRETVKQRLAAAMAGEAEKPKEERRARKDVQQEIYSALLAEHGVTLSAGGWVAESEAPIEGDQDSSTDAGQGASATSTVTDDARLAAQRGHYIFENDQAAQEVDIPSKWQRLAVQLEPFTADISDESLMADRAQAWTQQMRQAVIDTVDRWLQSSAGRDWAYRPSSVRPSDFRSEETWNAYLAQLRESLPAARDIAPDLSGLLLVTQVEADLRDPHRRNLRVMLENNSNEVAKRRRERFDHAVHQVELHVELPSSIHRPLRLDRVEPSYRFRDFLSYPGMGINCGVHETVDGEKLRLSTTWMPRYQQPRIVPTKIPGVPIEFSKLSADGFDPSTLRPLVAAFETWILDQESTVDPAQGVDNQEDADRERARFQKDIASFGREAKRIALGIDLLEFSYARYKEEPAANEGLPYRAWLLLNQTFLEAGAERGIEGWRLFQLAFVLAHLPTLASRMSEYAKSPWFDPEFDEETATLLYFATGGGKSEAFFGLLIFNLFFDRLRGKNVGVTALIRYPLRLLTLQQAQRLLALLMRAELIRRGASVGGAPFEIGFWVGRGNTPNRPDDDRLDPVPVLGDPKSSDDHNATLDYLEVNDSFNKIPICPLCEGETGLRRMKVGTADEIATVCFNKGCRWNLETDKSPLPFLIVDQDIYRHAPAVLLGVIDKLALIGQHPITINRVIGMFGMARWRERGTGRFVMPTRKMLKDGPGSNDCEPIASAYESGVEAFFDPLPSLIIQDEAHLLEESLGTFAGLFETLLEQLFLRIAALLGDRVARSPFGAKAPRLPKIVAATATVSVPQQQFGALYQRRHMHFPYPGTSIYRSFYSVPAVPNDPARRGLGGSSPRAPEVEAPWMRIYSTIMTNGRNHTVTTVAVLAAYHLAITEFWQDLLSDERRDAAVERLIGACSVNTPLTAFHAKAIRACAKGDASILPSLLDLMRISLTYVTNKKGGDQVIDAFREEVAKVHQRHGRDLEQLHTRLISGGVDVAEIQEIMREAERGSEPGSDFPQLSHSLRNIVATSAISHGVDVDRFNAMFFAGMPNDVAEFIQASSRVGRSHVGFSLLIPTPHARRDRYIVETHDIFHRFLERMIAPPAITRWAASAHDRVLTSVFQAWLCGWVEQKLFNERGNDDKERAPIFDTVNDVSRLFSGSELPGAAKDFMDFAVASLGVSGRGVSRIGAAPHPDFYEDRIRDRSKLLTDELRTQHTMTRLGDYWDAAAVGQRPMMSLRDIDDAGTFFPRRPFGAPRLRQGDEKELVADALRIVRRQRGRVGELDSDDRGD